MEKVTFTTRSKSKMALLVQVAKEMGIKASEDRDIEDGEVGVPGNKISKKQMENWLAKDNGKSYPAEEAFSIVKEELIKYRKKKKNAGGR
jgi:hypothetical protein